jgi:hypothetical protein
MRKFLGCDVLAILNEIMRHHTESYQEDFNIDKEILTEAAEENDKFDKRFLWMSRLQGTHCFPEKEVLLKDTSANHTWRYYDENSDDKIIAYAVEIDGFKDGVLKGDLYELDYHESANYVRNNAVPVVSVKLTYEDGKEITVPYENDWRTKLGDVHYGKREFIPDNEYDYNAAVTIVGADRKTARNYANWNLEKLKMEYGEDGQSAFSIYQLKSDEYRFKSYVTMRNQGYEPVVDDYEMIYTDKLNGASLNDIYERFNIDHPKDYVGYSLSVSDVIVLIKDGERTAYMVDSFGFKELPDFFSGAGGMQMQREIEM